MRPTTLLTDLDGVLRLWPKDYTALEQAHAVPPCSIAKMAFDPELLEQVITGRITDAAWRSEVVDRLRAAHPSCRAEEVVVAWSAPVGEVHDEVLRLVTRARQHCQVGLVTNATDRLRSDLLRLRLAQHFDFVVNSSEVGVAKPKPELFTRALAIARAKPEDAVFVDDALANVRAARELGIRSHHFRTPAGLADFMRSVGLLMDAA